MIEPIVLTLHDNLPAPDCLYESERYQFISLTDTFRILPDGAGKCLH